MQHKNLNDHLAPLKMLPRTPDWKPLGYEREHILNFLLNCQRKGVRAEKQMDFLEKIAQQIFFSFTIKRDVSTRLKIFSFNLDLRTSDISFERLKYLIRSFN